MTLRCKTIFRCLALFPALFPALAGAAEAPVLNVYNWADYVAPDTIANFEREFGIRVNYDLYDSTEVVEAKLLFHLRERFL
jgi:putrescine transport system substrate-binding protein